MPFYGQTPHYLNEYPPFSMGKSFEAMERAIPSLAQTTVKLVDLMAGPGMVGRNMKKLLWANRKIVADVLYVDGNETILADPKYDVMDRQLLSDVRALSLTDASADVVTIRAGLNNLAACDWAKTLDEILRITRQDGAIVMQDHFPLTEAQRDQMDTIETLIARHENRPVMPGLWTLDELQAHIEGRSWAITRVETFSQEFSLAERIAKKGLPPMECVTDAQIVYPISTVTLQKGAK